MKAKYMKAYPDNAMNRVLWSDEWNDGHGSITYFDCVGNDPKKRDTECTKRKYYNTGGGRSYKSSYMDTRCYGSGDGKKCIVYYDCAY